MMILTRDNNFTTVTFDGLSEEFISAFEVGFSQYSGVQEPGFEKSPQYKIGVWDGYTYLYDKKKHRIADGLYPQLVHYLKKLQEKLPNFSYSVIDKRDDPFMEVDDMSENITFKDKDKEFSLRDYQLEAIASAIDNKRGILNLSVNSGKTGTSVGIIKELGKYLERDETVAYFVPSLTIFSQAIKTFQENFGVDNVGYIGNSKRKLSKINVITLSSMASALKDPTKSSDVKLTGKARTLQIFVDEVLPYFDNDENEREILKNLIEVYPPSTKARREIKEWLKGAYNTFLLPSKIRMFLNGKNAEYVKIIQDKVGNKYNNYVKTKEFTKTVRIMIVDEGHHSGADNAYNTLLSFPNSQYKFAMTGSYDTHKELQTQRMKGLFGDVISKVSNDDMISRGVSAKPTINLVRIKGDLGMSVSEEKDYMKVVDKGIVHNEDRNNVISTLAKKMYELDQPTLIIVGRVEHGEILSEQLESMNVPNVFLQGSVKGDDREQVLSDYKAGKIKVIIATSIFDEGLSVNTFKVLFMVSSTRSPRLIIQRIGRVLRKKDDGTNEAIVFDFYDETNIFLKRQGDARLKIYNSEKFKTKFLN